MKILAIECSSAVGSVALKLDERISVREIETPREQTERLLQLVDELLTAERLAVAALDAVAFGRGPGSFTGLRMAAAVAQGFALACGVPLLPVSSLLCLAQGASRTERVTRSLVCVDARMGEVYWGEFATGDDGVSAGIGAERLSSPADVRVPAGAGWAAVGDGFARYPELTAAATAAPRQLPALLPKAIDLLPRAVADLEAGRSVAPPEALPVYLRDRTAWRRSQGP
jgi:tRNA threonylcarbamoyladenosine biosynthesis protein TsaB